MEMSNFGYGYKLKLNLVNPYGNNSANGTPQDLERMIFVPAQKNWIRVIRREIINNNNDESSIEETVIRKINVFLWQEPIIIYEYKVGNDWKTQQYLNPTDSWTAIRGKIIWNDDDKWQYWNDDDTLEDYLIIGNISENNQIFKQYCYSKNEPDDNAVWLDAPIYCGEYWVPEGVKVSDIVLYNGAQATFDYKAHFNLDYLNINTPQYCEIAEEIAGRTSNTWEVGQNIAPILKNKYYSHIEENNIIYEYSLDSWYDMTFNGEKDSIVVLISTTDNFDLQSHKLNDKGLYDEISEIDPETNETIIKKIYLDPNLPINQCIIQENVIGSINYKAYILKRTYV